MTFSTDSTFGVRDRWNGAADYEYLQFRYVRNAYYSESPLFRAGRDLEVCSALLYLRILFEAGIKPAQIGTQPGWEHARQVIEDTCATTDALIALQENARLRARVRYLTAALRGAMSMDDLAAFDDLGLIRLSRYLEGTLDMNEILYPPGVQTISAHLGGDIFRLPWSVPLWETGDNAANLLDHLLSRVPAETDPTPVTAANTNHARLGAGQDCLLVSREPQRLRVGRSASSRTDLGDINEFLHLAVPASAAQLSLWKTRYGSKGLAVLLVFDPDGKETGQVVIVPVPSAISFGKDRLLIRINCGGLMELSREKIAGYGDATIDVWFAVLGWSGAWN